MVTIARKDRRGWENLTAAYRRRLEGAGVTREQYEQGASLKAARGKAHTPESPERALARPERYAGYIQRRYRGLLERFGHRAQVAAEKVGIARAEPLPVAGPEQLPGGPQPGQEIPYGPEGRPIVLVEGNPDLADPTFRAKVFMDRQAALDYVHSIAGIGPEYYLIAYDPSLRGFQWAVFFADSDLKTRRAA